jgi:hypothetical protein
MIPFSARQKNDRTVHNANVTRLLLLSSGSFFARASPGFDSVFTLQIRLHIPDDRESRRGPLGVRCKNSKRRLARNPTFDYTFDIPVEVAAAASKYRHDRWKIEWGKPSWSPD